jgi:hypothetical protein
MLRARSLVRSSHSAAQDRISSVFQAMLLQKMIISLILQILSFALGADAAGKSYLKGAGRCFCVRILYREE